MVLVTLVVLVETRSEWVDGLMMVKRGSQDTAAKNEGPIKECLCNKGHDQAAARGYTRVTAKSHELEWLEFDVNQCYFQVSGVGATCWKLQLHSSCNAIML